MVEEAALPFDRRRHGMIVGMGAAALVVESAEAARERGVAPICEVLSAVTANSAFHGTRLDVHHISAVMETPRRPGGVALRHRSATRWRPRPCSSPTRPTPRPAGAAPRPRSTRCGSVFGDDADRIVMANTKGFTGHPMGVGIEDVVAVRSLETGLVPPVAELQGGRPGARAPEPLAGRARIRCATRCAWPRASARRSACPSCAGCRRPTAGGARPEELGFTHRIADPAAFKAWLGRLSGYDAPELEVDRRTLRVQDQGRGRARRGGRARSSARRPARRRPPAPAPATRAVSRPPLAASRAADPVKERILALVSEKTGYPADMLALDLDLEADLGIDTVKQAELFASVREEWGIPRDEKRKLRDYPTLSHVIAFVHQMRPDLAAARARDRGRRRPPAAPSATPPRPAGRGRRPGARADPGPGRPRRRAIRRTCWTSTSTSRPTSASTP